MGNNEGKKSVTIEVKTLVIIGLSVVVAVLIGILVMFIINKRNEKFISGDLIIEFKEIGELSTYQMDIQDTIRFEEGKTFLIDKKSFNMSFRGYVKAGIDPSKIKISVKGNTVIARLPKSEIQQIHVDNDSLKIEDKWGALFNWLEPEDTQLAVSKAEERIKTTAENSDLFDKADEHAEKIVRELLSKTIKKTNAKYKIEITHDN